MVDLERASALFIRVKRREIAECFASFRSAALPLPLSALTAVDAAVDAAESGLASRQPRLSISPSRLQKGALIGKGGFGLVYRCTHMSGATDAAAAGEEFALKQIHKARAAQGPLGAALVLRELAAYEELPAHPFVVTMHSCWQDARSVYLLLDLCSCTPLWETRPDGRPACCPSICANWPK